MANASDGNGDSRPSPSAQREALTDTADAYLSAHPGLIASISLRHGDTVLDYGAEQRYQTASIVKVEILLRWLTVRQDDTLPEAERELATRMITESDNEATGQLCELLSRLPEATDIPGGTGACVDDPSWGTGETTAADQTELLAAAFDGDLLTDDSRAVVTELMGSVVAPQSWGISAAADEGERTRLKNGWDIRDNGWLAHSEGVIDSHDGQPVYLTVLTDGSATEAEGIGHVEDLAELARDALG